MPSETKKCAACNQQYTLAADDYAFYEKLKVDPPRVCSDCQLQRRLAYRNERSLYTRKDEKNGKAVISFISPDKTIPVYPQDVWWGDSWDPLDYGAPYDFSKPFFEQFHDLLLRTPWPALINVNSTNSEYCNYSSYNENCYLIVGGDYNENCAYASHNMHSRDSMDLYFVEKCELCYDVTNSISCYRVGYSQYASNCSDSSFLYACTDCTNCIGCTNQRSKQYCILNQQYTKDAYEIKVKELNLGSHTGLERFRREFEALKQRLPHCYAVISNSENATGNELANVKNCINCFETYIAEDCKNLFLAGWNLKDSRSCSTTGYDSELIYDSMGVYIGCSRIRHSYFITGSFDIWYSLICKNSNNLFGCFGLKHKSFCILNKQYTEKEYNELVPRIIEHMKNMPYVGADGYSYQFGDYFPPQLSPFCYNETAAQGYFPLDKEVAEKQGFLWKEDEAMERSVTLHAKDIPDDLADVPDSLAQEVIGCEHKGECNEQCTRAFKMIPREFEFYKRMNIPLPRLCPNCRHYQRMKRRNPIKLWHRICMCSGQQSSNGIYTNDVPHAHGATACMTNFETPYAPDRPEIIYCEECYKAETI